MIKRNNFFELSALDPLMQPPDIPEEKLLIRADIPKVGPEGGQLHPEIVFAIQRACGSGQPLEGTLQEKMGASLDYDFSEVRVHHGAEADEFNRQLGARAFTFGNDVFFSQGAYDPASKSGLELIAHELVHVKQQSKGRVKGRGGHVTVCPTEGLLEQEVDNDARRAAKADYEDCSLAAESMESPNMDNDLRWFFVHNTEALPYSRILDTNTNRTLCRPEKQPTVIQRQLNTFIRAARNEINRLDSEPNDLRPNNCHEAVLGWLLTALGYPRRWRLIRLAVARHPDLSGLPTPQFTSTWMWNNFYTGFTQQVSFNNINLRTHRGDILVVGIGAAHSMVVIDNPQPIAGIVYPAPPGIQTHHVNIRGYNNIGTFLQLLGSANGLPPYTPGYRIVPGFPPMQYDNCDRDVADPRMWFGAARDQFGPAHSPLFVVRFNDALSNVAQLFPWENSAFMPTRIGQRWHYNLINGWRWF